MAEPTATEFNRRSHVWMPMRGLFTHEITAQL
jgi:hypothetical protein